MVHEGLQITAKMFGNRIVELPAKGFPSRAIVAAYEDKGF